MSAVVASETRRLEGLRIAVNQALFRRVNERIRDSIRSASWVTHPFVCECGDPACSTNLDLTLDEYARVRASAFRFVVIPGHVAEGFETVIVEHERYVTVEKHGEARAVVLSTTDGSS